MLAQRRHYPRKRILRYSFFIALFLRIVVSVYVVSQYLQTSGQAVSEKGGTFVEGIFDTTSYLPYLGNTTQSQFYQGLLFHSCLETVTTGNQIDYQDSLCHVTTRDYQTYYVTINDAGHTWSDGTPVSIDDIYFTYNDILHYNLRGITWLDVYTDLDITYTNDGRLKIVFPQSSIDNTLFFTNYILPQHVLHDSSLETYQQLFANNPVHSKCGRIKEQSSDRYSLIFDLNRCDDTNLGFYQIKNVESFDTFAFNIRRQGRSIVDAYIDADQISGYVQHPLLTHTYSTLFFNTNSDKLRVRTRRSLGGLIEHNFQPGNNMYIKKDPWLFTKFLTTGNTIDRFITEEGISMDISKTDLEDVGVTAIPNTISITGSDNKLVYFLDPIEESYNITFSVATAYDRISITHNDKNEFFPESYSASKKSASYNINPSFGNIAPGLNKYVIKGYDNGENKEVATLNLYYLAPDDSESDDINTQKIVVIYHRNPTSIFIVEQLQQIFSAYNILGSFSFQGTDSINELETKLIESAYDIALLSLHKGNKVDITQLLASEQPEVNPAQYTNSQFSRLYQQYIEENMDNPQLYAQINDIYARDMPFVFLGKELKSIYIQPDILRNLGEDIQLYENTWRETIYNQLRLVQNVHLDVDNARNWQKFKMFINNTFADTTQQQIATGDVNNTLSNETTE